jgi:glycosyltransferase involved in cell wall biosynthesis
MIKSLSVLVPTYKRAELLDRCLSSLIEAQVPFSEVIVGDDGGDAGTSDVCSKYSSILPLHRLPPPESVGSLAGNLKRLVLAASSEWCYLIHDDDFATGDHRAILGNITSDIDFLFTDHWVAANSGVIDKEESIVNTARYRRDRLRPGVQTNILDLILEKSFCLDGLYAKRRLLLSEDPQKEHGGNSDYFWLASVLLRHPSAGVYYNDSRSFAYRLSSSGITASGFDIGNLISGFRYLSKEFPEHRKRFERKEDSYLLSSISQVVRNGQFGELITLFRKYGGYRCFEALIRCLAEYFVLPRL